MTTEGAEKLKRELKKLKNEVRPKIIIAIKEAREKGDLKENAEYHAAREQQSLTEGKIRYIESKLSNAEIIDIRKMASTNKAVFASTIVLINLENNTKVTYKIVGEDEAELKEGKISFMSPLARNIIGKEEGDIIKLKTPNGIIGYEINKIKYE